MRRRIILLTIHCVLAMASCQTFAQTVQNAGFETPILSDGASFSGVPSGWSGPAASLEVVNPLFSSIVQPTEGENFMRMGDGYNALIQDLTVIEANTVYVVNVDVGIEGAFNGGENDWYRCALVYDGQPGNEFLVDILFQVS